MLMHHAICAFLKGRRAMIFEGENDDSICFEGELVGLRGGCIGPVELQSVWVQFFIDEVNDTQYARAGSVPLSQTSCIVPFPKDEAGIQVIAWQHSPQNLPWSKCGVKQVLEPIFDKAASEISQILTAIKSLDLPPLPLHLRSTPLRLITTLGNA
jgi:hypothetical protein